MRLKTFLSLTTLAAFVALGANPAALAAAKTTTQKKQVVQSSVKSSSKKSENRTTMKKVKKSAKASAPATKKSVARSGKSAKNETKKLYGVTGAKLRYVPVTNSKKTYTVKGQKNTIIGKNSSRNYSQTGVASFYHNKFHGRKTANGEIFDQTKYTAAHRTLAIGSYALVTNLKNGRKVIVRINDRGPFSNNRILDLSRAAASELGMISAGTARVRVEAMQVDRNGYISGKGAESLAQLAKREKLPLKVNNTGDQLAIKADITLAQN